MAEKRGKEKKSVLLRLNSDMWDDIASWAEDEFRSINGQIEYLLSETIKQHKKAKKDMSMDSGKRYDKPDSEKSDKKDT